MNGLQRLLLLSAVFLVAVPLAALSDLAPADLQANRERLEKWRQHPTEYARLREAAEKFVELPAEKRDKMLDVHHRLEQLPAAARTRLIATLDGYVNWLARLEPGFRAKLEATADRTKRLQMIRERREEEWLNRQPAAVRTEVAKLHGEPRTKRIQELRTSERQRKREWAIATRFWEELTLKQPLPTQLSEFPNDVQNYVTEYLMPKLSDEEKARLHKAEGHWPLYPQTLVELADRHPSALPDPAGPKTYNELPRDLQKRLKVRPGAQLPKLLQSAEGNARDFARAIASYAHKREIPIPLPHGLWPAGYGSLPPEVKQFVDSTLHPMLNNDEKFRLLQVNGIWPDYPQTLEILATRYGLRVPWPNLPGPASRWDKYRFKT